MKILRPYQVPWAALAFLSVVLRNQLEVLRGLLLPFDSQISCHPLDFHLTR